MQQPAQSDDNSSFAWYQTEHRSDITVTNHGVKLNLHAGSTRNSEFYQTRYLTRSRVHPWDHAVSIGNSTYRDRN